MEKIWLIETNVSFIINIVCIKDFDMVRKIEINFTRPNLQRANKHAQ